MVELLIFGGVMALAVLVVGVVAFVLHQRREGTVRAVLMPRRGRDEGGTST